MVNERNYGSKLYNMNLDTIEVSYLEIIVIQSVHTHLFGQCSSLRAFSKHVFHIFLKF